MKINVNIHRHTNLHAGESKTYWTGQVLVDGKFAHDFNGGVETMTHETLLTKLAGQFYDDVRDQIFILDWDGIYPEVDPNGCLTGRVIDAKNTDYEICDVTAQGVEICEGASDAMIDANAAPKS